MNRKHSSLVESGIERHMKYSSLVDSDIESDTESEKCSTVMYVEHSTGTKKHYLITSANVEKMTTKIERHTKHSSLVDSDIDSDTDSDKMFDCDVCGALYRDQETLSDHISKCGEDDHEDEGDKTVWEDII